MANQAATVMREFTRGNQKMKLGQSIKGRRRELSELAAKVSSTGDSEALANIRRQDRDARRIDCTLCNYDNAV